MSVDIWGHSGEPGRVFTGGALGMGSVMRVACPSRSRTTVAVVGPAVLATAVFVIAALAGNLFSLHVGSQTAAAAIERATSHSVVQQAQTGGTTSGGTVELKDANAQQPSSPLPMDSHGQHLMHLLGACMAVLAAIVLLWLPIGLRFRGPIVQSATRFLVTQTTLPSWTPPPLVPPRSSPVIRT